MVFFPHGQELFIGKANAIHALEGVIVGIAQPIGGRMSNGGKGLDLAGMRQVGTAAQVNQIATAIDRGTRAVGHLGLQQGNLEGIVGKQFEAFFFGNDETLKLLFLLDNLGHFLLDNLVYLLWIPKQKTI